MPVAPKTSYKQPRAGPSSHAGSSQRKLHPQPAKDPNAPMGVSKLKAAIRQTTRFLAKEKVDPAKRVEAERRLTSLKADLAAVERREIEKKNGAKYHMVKFFERQKLVRIIRRLQRELNDIETPETRDDKAKTRDLEDARIMLNYVLNFPNTSKYMSIFPPAADDGKKAQEKRLTLPPLLPSPYRPQHPVPSSKDETTTLRLEMLNKTRKLMNEGTLSKTPDEGLGTGRERPAVSIGNDPQAKEEGEVENKVEDDFFDVESDEEGQVSS